MPPPPASPISVDGSPPTSTGSLNPVPLPPDNQSPILLSTAPTHDPGTTRALLRSLEGLRDSLSHRVEQLSTAVERLRLQASELERALAEEGDWRPTEDPPALAPIVPTYLTRMSDNSPPGLQPDHPIPPRDTDPHPNPPGISTDVRHLLRPITDAEYRALLDSASQAVSPTQPTADILTSRGQAVQDRIAHLRVNARDLRWRASQPLESPRGTDGEGEGQIRVEALRTIREARSEARGEVRRTQTTRPVVGTAPGLIRQALAEATESSRQSIPPRERVTPAMTLSPARRGLAPTNIKLIATQPEPMVVRSSPASPTSTVTASPTSGFHQWYGPELQPMPAAPRPPQGVLSPLQALDLALPSESPVNPLPLHYGHSPLNPAARTAATNDEQAHRHAHVDETLTYRGRTVAARVGNPAILPTDPDESEPTFLHHFPFLREWAEPNGPSPASEDERAADYARMWPRLPILHTHRDEHGHDRTLSWQQLAERYRALPELEREPRPRVDRIRPDADVVDTSPMEVELRSIQRQEAGRLRALARDIVTSRPRETPAMTAPSGADDQAFQLQYRSGEVDLLERQHDERRRDLENIRRRVDRVNASATGQAQTTTAIDQELLRMANTVRRERNLALLRSQADMASRNAEIATMQGEISRRDRDLNRAATETRHHLRELRDQEREIRTRNAALRAEMNEIESSLQEINFLRHDHHQAVDDPVDVRQIRHRHVPELSDQSDRVRWRQELVQQQQTPPLTDEGTQRRDAMLTAELEASRRRMRQLQQINRDLGVIRAGSPTRTTNAAPEAEAHLGNHVLVHIGNDARFNPSSRAEASQGSPIDLDGTTVEMIEVIVEVGPSTSTERPAVAVAQDREDESDVEDEVVVERAIAAGVLEGSGEGQEAPQRPRRNREREERPGRLRTTSHFPSTELPTASASDATFAAQDPKDSVGFEGRLWPGPFGLPRERERRYVSMLDL